MKNNSKYLVVLCNSTLASTKLPSVMLLVNEAYGLNSVEGINSVKELKQHNLTSVYLGGLGIL